MPKLLGEFLQQKQEPFALDVYLLERGYPRGTTLNARAKSSAGCSLKKRRYVVPNCSKFLKAVFSQSATAKDNQKSKYSGNGRRKNALVVNRKKRRENAAEDNRKGIEDNLFLAKEVDADRKLKWRAVEDSKQLSPVSVREETSSDEVSPVHYTQGESSTSISGCKLKQPRQFSFQEVVGSNSYARSMINKRALLQTKQLLRDCVREAIESNRRRDKSREQILVAEEVWKLVCRNVWQWSQESIDETNIIHLLHYDFLASAEEWRSAVSERKKMEISMEIGDDILEDVISEIMTWSCFVS